MKAVIFAGGVGTRLWPLSRKKSPKQFEKVTGDKSSLQLAVERILPDFKQEDIYISTGEQYVDIIRKQLPFIPYTNILGEPTKRDNAPAVALAMAHLVTKFPDEPIIILWSDHLVKDVERFRHIIQISGDIIKDDPNKIIFIGQKARFASENLGWIEYGTKIKTAEDINVFELVSFQYRPDKGTAERYFTDNRHCWNLGYFVTSPSYLYNQYKKLCPEIYEHTESIMDSIGKVRYSTTLQDEYPKMPTINFDKAIIERMDFKDAMVINEDIQWSDFGSWEALKEALEKSKEDNVTLGNVMLEDSEDNLVYNYDNGKMIVGIDLNDFLVVNTNDILLITKKTSVPKIKKLIEKLDEDGKHDHIL